MDYVHFMGIDVSKNWFDVATHGTPDGAKDATASRYLNSTDGVASFMADIAVRGGKTLVVLEATGGYESALVVQKVAVHRACPLIAKHFIRSLRVRGKTDALARYGAERHRELALCQPTDSAQAGISFMDSRRFPPARE